MIKKFSEVKLKTWDDKVPSPMGDNENLLVYLSPINSKPMQERMGVEKLVKEIPQENGKIQITKSQYKAWRYLYLNNKAEIVGCIQGVVKDNLNILSNIYTRPDYRNQGIASLLLKQLKLDKKNLRVDSNMTLKGAKFFHYSKVAEWYDFARELNLPSLPEEGSKKASDKNAEDFWITDSGEKLSVAGDGHEFFFYNWLKQHDNELFKKVKLDIEKRKYKFFNDFAINELNWIRVLFNTTINYFYVQIFAMDYDSWSRIKNSFTNLTDKANFFDVQVISPKSYYSNIPLKELEDISLNDLRMFKHD